VPEDASWTVIVEAVRTAEAGKAILVIAGSVGDGPSNAREFAECAVSRTNIRRSSARSVPRDDWARLLEVSSDEAFDDYRQDEDCSTLGTNEPGHAVPTYSFSVNVEGEVTCLWRSPSASDRTLALLDLIDERIDAQIDCPESLGEGTLGEQ
jgi:hypothetical protein